MKTSLSVLLAKKGRRKARTKKDQHQVITGLTGCDEERQGFIQAESTLATFFEAADLHPYAPLIKGVKCRYRIQEIVNTLTRQVRYRDKREDELAI